ncbi:uncharacterized protein LOC120425116 [Culex pipiens pallens]|uniref:(northern house mosquito) hypothetical protein n=1 Tax=Culex pipiens TaxID=7175 RepID=A0A8D8ME93_CULPI|nr:uncharacterized protein LOC120425116 [Culex pipiens pallens]XP_039445457.1 uncharacterized protein LOC120425116 [Culex pipiens pallens]
MSKVVECIKCICGCNEVTRDRIKELLNKTIHGFLNDEAAVNMLKKYIPKESLTHKHITIVQQAKHYQTTDVDKSSDEWEDFVDSLLEDLAEELEDSADTNAALENVVLEYSRRIDKSNDFKNFNSNLRDKYKQRFR